ncbi:MAG: ATP-binding cassette domain-containing protein [Chitinophagaceae bacterium]
MKISCTKTGKRFNRDWIFRNFSYVFIKGGHYAITGPNGSGKSTLLQVIAGAIVSSEGNISYESGEQKLVTDNIFTSLAIAAPYLEVIEEMTLMELLQFHRIFKPFLPGVVEEDMIAIMGLQAAAHKQIRYYSSGMKQRVKLAQAIFSDTPCLLLDEPCTNLDDAGTQLYHQLIEKYCKDRLVIVSSNDKQEYSFCNEVVNIMSYK